MSRKYDENDDNPTKYPFILFGIIIFCVFIYKAYELHHKSNCLDKYSVDECSKLFKD